MSAAAAILRLLCCAAVTAATLVSFWAAAPHSADLARFAGGLYRDPAAALQALEALQPAPAALPTLPPAAAPPAPKAVPEAPPLPAAAATPAPLPLEEAWDGVIPENCGPVQAEFFPQGSSEKYIAVGKGSIKNCTSVPAAEIASLAAQGLPFAVEPDSDQPQVLIMHTHTTESYLTQSPYWYPLDWGGRTTDQTLNMCAVGAAMARVLNEAGVCTVQDTTYHDYPSYNGSYERSNLTVRQWLEQYPSIKVVLDVHRDAIERNGTLIAPRYLWQDSPVAQVMLICGCDKNGNLPDFRQNLRFAAAWEQGMEALYPGLTRPVLFDYRYYNQDLTTGSLLIEVGGHGNTLAQAVTAGEQAAAALAAVLKGQV